MATKWKVKDGKKYVWDTFANRWSYRGAVPYPIEEGEYKDTLPPPPKGAKVSQVPELSNVLTAPYQAAMAGVTKLGEAISKPVMDIGVGLTQGVKEVAEEQFPKREQDSIYAPTAGEKMMTKGQEIARSVLDVSPPVAKSTEEPKVQINPPIRPAAQPSISVTPPTSEEELAAARYKAMDVAHIDSVLSSMKARDEQMDLIVQKNPWLGSGFSVKLDLPAKVEPVAPIAKPVKLPQSEAAKWAEDEAKAYTGTKIASRETMDALKSQLPEDSSKIPVVETPAEKIPLSFREEPVETGTRRPGASAYADEYKRRYQMALAGRYGTI